MEFTDDGRRLSGRADGGRIRGYQREANTFLFGSENTGVNAPVFSSFATSNILRKSSHVNCRGRTFTTTSSPILTIYRKSYGAHVCSRNVNCPKRRDALSLMVALSAIYNAKDRADACAVSCRAGRGLPQKLTPTGSSVFGRQLHSRTSGVQRKVTHRNIKSILE